MSNYLKTSIIILATVFVVGLGKTQASQEELDSLIPKDPKIAEDFRKIFHLIEEYNEKIQASQKELGEQKPINPAEVEDTNRIIKLVKEYNERIKTSEKKLDAQSLINPKIVEDFQKLCQSVEGWGEKAKPPKMEIDYQRDIDPKRVQDVHKIAQLVEDFYEKKGYYPLADGNFKLPVDVAITTKKYEPSPGAVPMQAFEKELKSVLGDNVKLPIDPQKVDAWGGPRLYQYYSDGKGYFVSAYLFFPTVHTRLIRPYTHKYQVGSMSVPERKIFKFAHIKEGKRSAGLAYDYEDIGLVHLDKSELDEAEKMLHEALEIYERLNMQRNIALVYRWLAEIYWGRDKLGEAEKMLYKSLEIFKRLGLQKNIAEDYLNLGVIYSKQGKKDKAREYWTKSRDLYAEIGMPEMVKAVQEELNGLGK